MRLFINSKVDYKEGSLEQKRRGVARIWVVVGFLAGLVFGGYGMHTASLKWFGDKAVSANNALTEPLVEPKPVRGQTQAQSVQQTRIEYVTVPQKVDTAAIIKDYFAKRTYSQPIEDENIKGVWLQDVSQNQITSPGLFKYEIKKQSKTQGYFGVEVNGSISPVKLISVEPYAFVTFGKVGVGASYNIQDQTVSLRAGFRGWGGKPKFKPQ